MELDWDCCPFVIKVAWEPETQSSLTLPDTAQGGAAQCFWWGKIIRKLSSIIIWLHPKISTTNRYRYLYKLSLVFWFAGFLVYNSPDNLNMLPCVNPTTLWVVCSNDSHWLTHGVSSLWLVGPVTLCHVDVWFWSSHDLGLTSRHSERESKDSDKVGHKV